MKRKIHNFKIQQKVLFYLLGFIFVILCIFYLAQVVFLKDFYMFIKEQGVTKATEQIKASLQQGYDYDEIQEIASSQDFCVYTYGIGNSDEPYYIAAIAGNFRACPNQPLLLDRYEELYLKAKASTNGCLLYTSPSPRDRQKSRMPSSA